MPPAPLATHLGKMDPSNQVASFRLNSLPKWNFTCSLCQSEFPFSKSLCTYFTFDLNQWLHNACWIMMPFTKKITINLHRWLHNACFVQRVTKIIKMWVLGICKQIRKVQIFCWDFNIFNITFNTSNIVLLFCFI